MIVTQAIYNWALDLMKKLNYNNIYELFQEIQKLNNNLMINLLAFLVYSGIPYWYLRNSIRSNQILNVNECWKLFTPLFHITNKFHYCNLGIQVIYTLLHSPPEFVKLINSRSISYSGIRGQSMSMDQLIEHINHEIKSAISILKDDRVLDYTTLYSLTTFIKDQFKSSINKNNHYISKPKDISQDLQKIKEFFFTYNLYLPNIISLDTYKLSLGAN